MTGLRRRMLSSTAAVSLAAIIAVPAPAVAERSAPLAARVQQALDRVVDAGSPGAIAVMRVGSRTIRLASGAGELDPVVAMRPGVAARMGGITKSFTATVVLQLVGEHRLGLGDTVEQRLPGILPYGAAVTVRQLLNHTSGVFDYAQDPRTWAPYMDGDLTAIFDPRDGVRYAAEHDLLFPPGTALAYSNTNYLLLAMMVEAVTGRSFGAELRRRVIAPLALRHTSYPMSSAIAGPHVHGYRAEESPPVDVTALSPTVFGAAGALLSTADDLADFYRALLRGRLLPARLLREMRTIDPAATGGVPDAGLPGGGWGLGLLREEFPCGVAWGHDSEIPGFTTAAWSSGDGSRQITVIVNTNTDPESAVNNAVRALLTTAYCGAA